MISLSAGYSSQRTELQTFLQRHAATAPLMSHCPHKQAVRSSTLIVFPLVEDNHGDEERKSPIDLT